MVQLDSTRQMEPTADQEAELKPEEDRCSRLGRRCGYATRGSMQHSSNLERHDTWPNNVVTSRSNGIKLEPGMHAPDHEEKPE